jgi:hypothetical protein
LVVVLVEAKPMEELVAAVVLVVDQHIPMQMVVLQLRARETMVVAHGMIQTSPLVAVVVLEVLVVGQVAVAQTVEMADLVHHHQLQDLLLLVLVAVEAEQTEAVLVVVEVLVAEAMLELAEIILAQMEP